MNVFDGTIRPKGQGYLAPSVDKAAHTAGGLHTKSITGRGRSDFRQSSEIKEKFANLLLKLGEIEDRRGASARGNFCHDRNAQVKMPKRSGRVSRT